MPKMHSRHCFGVGAGPCGTVSSATIPNIDLYRFAERLPYDCPEEKRLDKIESSLDDAMDLPNPTFVDPSYVSQRREEQGFLPTVSFYLAQGEILFEFSDVPDYLKSSVTYSAGQFLKSLRLTRKRQMWDKDDELRDIIQRLFPKEARPEIDRRHFGHDNWSKWAAYLTTPLGPKTPLSSDKPGDIDAPKAVPDPDSEEETLESEGGGGRRKKGGGKKKKGKGGGGKSRGGGRRGKGGGGGGRNARRRDDDEAQWEAEEEEAWLRWQKEEREKRERERERQLVTTFEQVDLTESQTPCTIQTTSHILDEWYAREEIRQVAAEETFARLWLEQEADWKAENDAMRVKHPYPKKRSESRRGLDPISVKRRSTERICRTSSSRPCSAVYSSGSSSPSSERRCCPIPHHRHRNDNQSKTFIIAAPVDVGADDDRARMPPPREEEKEEKGLPPLLRRRDSRREEEEEEEEGEEKGEEPLERDPQRRKGGATNQHQVPLSLLCI